MPELTDAQLVQRSAGGDREAYVRLVLRYRGSLAALIRRLVSDLDEAEDLLQDTLVQGWVSIGEVRNPERVQTWLLQVARNRCRDYHKSADRRVHPTEPRELDDYVNRSGPAARPRRPEVVEAVQSLSPAQREVVHLFYEQGLTLREICAHTQAPAGTVKSRLFTARHHLRERLEEERER